jgi:hypothetical protein
MVVIMKYLLPIKGIVICWLALFITVWGCTSRITSILKQPDVSDYYASCKIDDLAIGISIQEKPGNPNPFKDKPFKSMNMFVLNVRIENTGQDALIINREDIVLTTKDGRMYVPLSKHTAASRDRGPMKIYKRLSLSAVAYGYQAFGLDEHIVLRPGEKKCGYLYYRVSKKRYNLAMEGTILISSSRISEMDMSTRDEFSLELAQEREK